MAAGAPQSTVDVLAALLDNIAPTTGHRLMATAFWDDGRAARIEVLANAAKDALTAAHVAGAGPVTDRRRGHEVAMWLRKTSEMLATLVRFGERDESRDFVLWIKLTMHRRRQKVLNRLSQTLGTPPSPKELDWAYSRARSAADVAATIGRDYTAGDSRPWFISPKTWPDMLSGGKQAEAAIQRWTAPTAETTLHGAQEAASDIEAAVLGQYDLIYGHYSGQVHAGAPAAVEPWETMDPPLLELAALLVGARLAQFSSPVAGLHERIEIVSARQPHGTSVAPALSVGDKVNVLATYTGEVLEISDDGVIARVRNHANGTTELRPRLHLRRL